MAPIEAHSDYDGYRYRICGSDGRLTAVDDVTFEVAAGQILRCLCPSDLRLSDSCLGTARCSPRSGRCPSPLPRDWVRPARSHRVGSAEIKMMRPSEDVWRRRLLPGPLSLGLSLAPGTKGTAPDRRIWEGSRLTDVSG